MMGMVHSFNQYMEDDLDNNHNILSQTLNPEQIEVPASTQDNDLLKKEMSNVAT